jgi:hypothetical protein
VPSTPWMVTMTNIISRISASWRKFIIQDPNNCNVQYERRSQTIWKRIWLSVLQHKWML